MNLTNNSNSLQEIADAILANDCFTIIGHAIPDGDCIGSVLAVHLMLKALGKTSNTLIDDVIPSNYSFLSSSNEIKNLQTIPQIYSNVIFVDCGGAQRCGFDLFSIKEKEDIHLIINIDHHQTNTNFGYLNYVDADAAAASEILVSLFHLLPAPISPEMADALYTALIMDTGNFQYGSTTSHTLKVAAELLECGADLNRIRIAMYESKDKREIQMMALALSHMHLSRDGEIAWMYLTLDEVKSIDSENYHPEGLVNFIRSIDGVEVAVHFREMGGGTVKVGFRSKNTVDVSKIAAHFEGGGHIHASGAKFEDSLENVIQTVIPYIGEVLKKK